MGLTLNKLKLINCIKMRPTYLATDPITQVSDYITDTNCINKNTARSPLIQVFESVQGPVLLLCSVIVSMVGCLDACIMGIAGI